MLPSGSYRLEASQAGFQRSARSGIVVELGRTVRLDLVMNVGQVSETVEVSGATPMIESETASVGQFIENKTIVRRGSG